MMFSIPRLSKPIFALPSARNKWTRGFALLLLLTSHGSGVWAQNGARFAQGYSGDSTLSIGDVSLREGDAGVTEMQFFLTLDAPSSGEITVNYRTLDGTATSETDYESVGGTLRFAPGQTAQSVAVQISGDGLEEGDETFFVDLSEASGATLVDAQGLGLIFNDDEPPIEADSLIVTTTRDVVALDGLTSLREAMSYANARAGADTIAFNIPRSDTGFGGDVWTLRPQTELPTLTDNGTTIDGATQTLFGGDSNLKGPEIVLNGSSPLLTRGLYLEASYCVIKDMVVNGFTFPIWLRTSAAHHNQVRGCYVGMDPSGESSPVPVAFSQQTGIEIGYGAAYNLIGGSTPAERNIISGNDSGVGIYGAGQPGQGQLHRHERLGHG